MNEVADDKFGWPYLCVECRRAGSRIKATIRVFSGICGFGFAACDVHAKELTERALKPLVDGSRISADYAVRAKRVEIDEFGWPFVGKTIWEARRRATAAPA